MRVAIGAVAGTLGGPATYAIELVRALLASAPAGDSFTVITDRPEAFGDDIETVRVPLSSAWEQPLWDHLRVRRVLAGGGFDLYHGTKGVLPLLAPVPSVVTIHDLASYVQPETFRFAQRLHLAVETPAAVRRARAVITDSESSAADIRRFFPATAGRVEVIPLGPGGSAGKATDEEIRTWRRGRGIEGPCVGYLGTIQPRKNLDLLAAAFTDAAAAAGGDDWQLLIAGRLRPGYRPACLDSDDPRVVYLGPLDDAEIAPFLGSLACMVSPSTYEGFGLSFLEAMAAGCPVIGLRNSSVPEVVGEAGILLDGPDRAALAEAMTRLMTDAELGQDLRRRGLERATRFSWEATARLTRAVYQSVAAGGATQGKERR